MTELAPLGVVVVHFGGPAAILRCLRSLRADPSRIARRIAVVDNGSEDGCSLDPATLGSDVALLSCPDNPGFGGGANRGVELLRSGGDLLGYVILNHDVEILPGYLDAAADALAGGAGAAGGPLYLDRPDGPLWYAGGRLRRLTGTVQHSSSPADAARAREVGFLTGAAFAAAATAWDEVGGFDPGIFLYHEDVDLCLRLRRAGWHLRFVPQMRAVHHLGTSTGSSEASPFYLEHMARTRLRPYRSRLYRLYLAALHTAYVAVRAGGILARQGAAGRPEVRALVRGHRDALRDIFRR